LVGTFSGSSCIKEILASVDHGRQFVACVGLWFMLISDTY